MVRWMFGSYPCFQCVDEWSAPGEFTLLENYGDGVFTRELKAARVAVLLPSGSKKKKLVKKVDAVIEEGACAPGSGLTRGWKFRKEKKATREKIGSMSALN